MAKKFRIMIVDDSPQEIHSLIEELKADFIVTAAMSADNAMKMLAEGEKPNLILLDVNMPGMNGHEACEMIKSDPNLHEIDIIFLSANDSTEEIIRGLDVGAADYITKPFDPDVLRSKIRRVVNSHDKRIELMKQADSASKLVYTLISESGKLGNIVNFLRASFTIKNAEGLMAATIDALRQYDLNSVIYFNSGSIVLKGSTSGEPTMLEVELLERMHGYDEPILEKGVRVFILQESVVVLIKNMPEDEGKRGSLKDQLMILLDGANAKLKNLSESAEQSNQKIEEIRSTVMSAKNSLDEIHVLQENHKIRSMNILDEMIVNVERSFFSMGLTDDQEKDIMDILSGTVSRSLENFEHGMEVDKKVKNVVLSLSKLATKSVD